jgi:hypothetical protein
MFGQPLSHLRQRFARATRYSESKLAILENERNPRKHPELA